MSLDSKQKRGAAIGARMPGRQWLGEPAGRLPARGRYSLLGIAAIAAAEIISGAQSRGSMIGLGSPTRQWLSEPANVLPTSGRTSLLKLKAISPDAEADEGTNKSLALGTLCCCACPSKVEAGLPDYIAVTREVLTVDDEAELPEDIESGACDGGDWYRRFTFDRRLIDLVAAASITYDFDAVSVSTLCGTCCFRYINRGDYTPECPTGLDEDYNLLGASPFTAAAVGGVVQETRYSGSPVHADPGDEPFESCCPTPSEMDCSAHCGHTIITTGGEIHAPLPLHSASTLTICINGSVVTICEAFAISVPCEVTQPTGGGQCVWNADSGPSNGLYPECPPSEGGYTESCDETVGCSYVVVNITLTATADLSGVSGATIWDKIKNAPAETWVATYEFAACSCAGGGCIDAYGLFDCLCDIFSNCFCDCLDSEGNSVSEPTSETEDQPVDIECQYATGTIESTFDDGAAP